MASVTFTSAANGGYQGADTGVVASFGGSIVGNLLFGTATKWRLVTLNPLGGTNTVVFELNDPALVQGNLTSMLLVDTPFLGSAAVFANVGGVASWTWTGITDASTLVAGFNSVASAVFAVVPVDVFNCDCETVSTYDTLLNVRTKIMNRIYPNQASTPPPGISTMIDQHLRDTQSEIFRQLERASLRTERFFKWTMVPGQRYYNLGAEEVNCHALDPTKISWVGFEDLNKAWYRLDEGIPPEYYTRANINFGWPTRFEIRSCIEIFPAPQAAYTLWVKGDFGLGPLVADTDRFTIDDMAVYLLALGNFKADRGAKDAQLVLTQAGNYTKGLVAGMHGTRRYVPRAQTENPLTPPRFLPLGTDQA